MMTWPEAFNNVGMALVVAIAIIGFVWAMGRL